jgi:hypothetical protein
MKYLLAIYTPDYWEGLSEAEQEAETNAYWQLDVDATNAGVFLASEPLQPPSETVTVRVSGDEAVVTDGPFVETKEFLGGFYLLDCASAEEAAGWAAKIPGARHGRVEVTPVMEFDPPEWVTKATSGEPIAGA